MSDDKLDVIQTTVNKISTDIAVLVNEMQTMNERGCQASMSKIELLEKDIDRAKGMAVGGGVIGSIIATGISIFSYFQSHKP